MNSTGFLFSRPSFLTGIMRVLDLGRTMNNNDTSSNPAEADARALYSDWYCVGQDLKYAFAEAIPEDDL